MNEFTWQARYQVGNEKIDQQHQQLFDLANKLVQSKTQLDLAENVMCLYKHVREHFQQEELVMKAHHYSDYQDHVNDHNLMLDKLVEASDKVNKSEWQQQEVVKFMHEWISHILEKDMAISEYLQADSSRQKPQS